MAEIHQEMRELLDKQVNAQKEITISGVHFLCAMKMKGGGGEKKQHARKNDIDGRNHFITLILRNCESDLHEPQGNDYEYNEDTIC